MAKGGYKEDKDLEKILVISNDDRILKAKEEISKIITSEIKIIAKNESQKKLINSIKNNEITICAGKAGSGKTFVSLAYALSLIRKKENKYKKIYLVKSVTPLNGENVGFLKGTLDDKIFPFLMSFYINIEKVVYEGTLKMLIEKEYIKPLPLAYMRGVSLDDCIIVTDEVQNITMENAHTLMTRIGSNCKLIMLGDTNQIDILNRNDSSLKHILNIFKDIEKIGIIEMDESDINIRNPLIDIIDLKYGEFFKSKNNK